MTIPANSPQPNQTTQGAAAFKNALIDPAHDVWLLNTDTKPANGDGNGYAGTGSIAIDHVLGAVYINTGTLAATVWATLESTGGAVTFSSADALTAHSGGGKTSALALSKQVNRFSTVAAELDSALLPASAAGGFVVVTNGGAHGADLYGAGSDTINDVLTTTAFYLPDGATALFYSTVAGKWYGGIIGGILGSATESQPSNPTAPANTSTYFMQGLAGAITPKKYGNALVTVRGNMIGSSTTAGDGILLQGSYGTGAAPANAAALAGTQVGAVQEYTNPATVTAADINVPFSMTFLVPASAVTLGVALWLDLAAKSVANASHVGLANVDITAVEVG
jgi:hypothetical protein